MKRLLTCLNITLDSEDLSCWHKRKKWFLWTMAAANHGDEWGFTWYLRCGIYTSVLTWIHIYINSNLNSLTKFTSSSKITEFKDILPWNISQMITKTILISTRIFISNAMKRGIPLWIWCNVNGNWANNMIRISQCGENHCRTNTNVHPKQQDSENHSLGYK